VFIRSKSARYSFALQRNIFIWYSYYFSIQVLHAMKCYSEVRI